MEDKIGKQSIDRLNVKQAIVDILKDNKISTLNQLSKKTKTDLKKIGLVTDEIHQTEIEMQLLGLCLKNGI